MGHIDEELYPLLAEALEVVDQYVDICDLALVDGACGLVSSGGSWDPVGVASKVIEELKDLLRTGRRSKDGQPVAVWFEQWDTAEMMTFRGYSEHSLGKERYDRRYRDLQDEAEDAAAYTIRLDDYGGTRVYVVNFATDSPSSAEWARMLDWYHSCSDACVDNNSDWDVRKRMAAVAMMAYVLLHELLHVAFDTVYEYFTEPRDGIEVHLVNTGLMLRDDRLVTREEMKWATEVLSYKISNVWLRNAFGDLGYACDANPPLQAVITNPTEQDRLARLNSFSERPIGMEAVSEWVCAKYIEGQNIVLVLGRPRGLFAAIDMSYTGSAPFPEE